MLTIVVFLMTLWLSSTQAFALCAAPVWAVDAVPPPGSLAQYKTIFSPALGANMSYAIYLPPSYNLDSSTRYPVLYWLHGGGSNLQSGENFVNLLNDAIIRGVAPQFIVVLPNGPETMWTNSNPGKTPFDAPIETAIINDLIPTVDSNYRTIATRDGRGIEGFSMGGRGASRLGLKYPDRFGLVSDLAGAVGPIDFWQNYTSVPVYSCIFGNDAAYFNATDPFTHASTNAGLIQSLGPYHFRIVVGDQDGRGTYDFSLAFSDHLTSVGIDHSLVVVPGVGHSYQNLYTVQGDSMFTFFADAWSDTGGGGGGGSGDTAAPSTPQGIRALTVGRSQLTIGWTAAVDNVAVVGYKIYRNGAQISTVTSPSYTDRGLKPRTSYLYSVSAFDAAGNESARSASTRVTTSQ